MQRRKDGGALRVCRGGRHAGLEEGMVSACKRREKLSKLGGSGEGQEPLEGEDCQLTTTSPLSSMKLCLANPATGQQKTIEIDDERRTYVRLARLVGRRRC